VQKDRENAMFRTKTTRKACPRIHRARSKAKVVLLISALAYLTGCSGVVSLHPLALPHGKGVVFDPALLGTWEESQTTGDVAKNRYTVARADSGYSFRVVMGADEMKGTIYLVKVGDRYLLDVYCPSDGEQLPVHFFVRLRMKNDTAWVAAMDSDWLQHQIKTRGELRHELLTESDLRLVLTASSAELRKYLLPYAGDDRAFGEECELRRIAPKGK
jgi:hypothetical protein